MRMRFLLIALLFIGCVDAQIPVISVSTGTGTPPGDPPIEFPAVSGAATFSMDDIPLENIPDLFLDYDLPEGGNLPILVFVHGWSGGGGLFGSLDDAARDYLKENGIGMMSIGMRGRNTGAPPSYATDGTTMEEYRDAGGLEDYDAYKTVKYFIEQVAVPGKIDKSRIIFYSISGGGGAGYGCAAKFPGLISTNVLWYAIGKYGTYENDPLPSLTSWYTDNVFYEGQIQESVGSPPKGETGYAPGAGDEYYIARDHLQSMSNSAGTKFFLYHDTNDGTVFDDMSTEAASILASNGQDYEYFLTSNGANNHGKADLLVGWFDLSPQHGLDWVDDAKSITRTQIPGTGTLKIPGFLIPLDEDLEPIFEFWIKTYRKNFPASPKSSARENQGKKSAAIVTYDLAANTFVTQLNKGNNVAGDQFHWVDITYNGNNLLALLATTDVVTLKPTTWNQSPASIASDWSFYYDFSTPDYYLLDDASKVSNVWDLTGNNNLAFQEVRATRAAIVSGSLDNGVIKQSGQSGKLAVNVDPPQLTGEFTIAFSCDPDQATIGSFADQIIGRGAGSASVIYFGNFSGKISINFDTETGDFISNSTPANSNLGKQVWVIRRDGSNVVTASCKNSTSTYTYTLGTSAGTFIPRFIGAGSSSVKQFSGKIYKVAASEDRLSDGDVTTLLNDWYGEATFANVVTEQSGNTITTTFNTLVTNQNAIPTVNPPTIAGGTPTKDQVLTGVSSGFYSPGGYGQLPSLWQWYRADDKQSVGSAIGGATAINYTLVTDDVGKVIGVEETAVQDGGINDEGTPVRSLYTEAVADTEFNPFTDIDWFIAAQPSGGTKLATDGYWQNDDLGNDGNNLTRNGSDNIPTFTGGIVDFEASNNEELVLDQPSTQFTGGVDVYIRCKVESYNAAYSYILSWNSSQNIQIRAGGQVYLSGATCDYTVPLNTWVILHFVISQSANTSEFQVNGGTLKTNVAASTAAFGTSNGRVGSNSGGTGNRADIAISHIFVKKLNAERFDTEMDTWFDSYFPND